MSYYAIVAPLTNLRPHTNADRLQVATAAGYQVIVTTERREGELGVVFPEEGEISPSLAMYADLYRKNPITGDKMGGYLEANGRVQTLRLRGEESRGLWLPLEKVQGVCSWIPKGREKPIDGHWTSEFPQEEALLSEGDQLDSLGGVPLCRKYYSRATREALRKSSKPGDPGKPKKKNAIEKALAKHYDTKQLRDSIAMLPPGEVVVTMKLHGTSGRTGRVPVEMKLPWYKRAWNRLNPFSVGRFTTHEVQYITGTRNTAPVRENTRDEYRWTAHQAIKAMGLDVGETWYYELVGWSSPTKPIMGHYGLSKLPKDVKARVKDEVTEAKEMVFSYGTAPGEFSIFVYRIVRDGRELTYPEILERVQDRVSVIYDDLAEFKDLRKIDVVPHLATLPPGPTLAEIEPWTRWSGHELEKTNFREGVCIRVEQDGECLTKAYKYKGFEFCAIEGIRFSDPSYVDPEVVA